MTAALRNHRWLVVLLSVVAISSETMAQGLAVPLTIQGMEQRAISGARARAMGGCVTATGNDATMLFGNPASLCNLSMAEARMGGLVQFSSQDQIQEWRPDVIYAGLSLLLENNFFGVDYTGKQKPYDNLSPNWNVTNRNARMPLLAFAIPLKVQELKIALGIGGSEAISLNHYFQNRNVLSPYLGTYRPAPVPRVSGDTLRADWYQFIRERKGGIYGITPAFSIELSKSFRLGLSGTYYSGRSSDLEERHDRGRFFSRVQQYFRMDSIYYHVMSAGNSSYVGFNGTVGAVAGNSTIQIGAVLHTPLTIRRTWDRKVALDTSNSPVISSSTGTDRLHVPLGYSFGIALHPTKLWTIGLDFVDDRAEQALYETDSATISNVWVGGQAIRMGIEYLATDWLAVRGGYREDVQAFPQEGDALPQDPVRGSVYSGGIGLELGLFRIDLVYEYVRVTYFDAWMSNTNYNSRSLHRLSVETGYKF